MDDINSVCDKCRESFLLIIHIADHRSTISPKTDVSKAKSNSCLIIGLSKQL